jgi:hypothetical protein
MRERSAGDLPRGTDATLANARWNENSPGPGAAIRLPDREMSVEEVTRKRLGSNIMGKRQR